MWIISDLSSKSIWKDWLLANIVKKHSFCESVLLGMEENSSTKRLISTFY